MNGPVRLLLCDDHAVVRAGLRALLSSTDDIEVVGEAGSGEEALAVAARVRPDVVLMDLQLGDGMDGVTATRELTSRAGPRVLVLTMFDTDADIARAIEAGATGYLLKDAPREDLLRAIRAAADGDAVLAPSVASRLVGRVRAPESSLLSPRELEVLALVADGATNRVAGERLHLSEATVKTHLLSIYGKLGVGDRAAAVAEGFRRGLLTL